jgi:hypothetical protein
VLHTISSCFICYIFTSNFGHTHDHFSWVSVTSFHFTKHQLARKKKEKKCHFPTDPHYCLKISSTPNDLKALGDCKMLNTQLLDCLIQCSAPPPPNEETFFQFYLGSLGTRSYLESCNALVNINRGPLVPSNWNRIQVKIKGIRSTFDHLFSDVINAGATKTLIVPIVNAFHFFVLVVEFNFKCPELFLRFEYNDLLRRSSRGQPGIMQPTRHPCMAHCL